MTARATFASLTSWSLATMCIPKTKSLFNIAIIQQLCVVMHRYLTPYPSPSYPPNTLKWNEPSAQRYCSHAVYGLASARLLQVPLSRPSRRAERKQQHRHMEFGDEPVGDIPGTLRVTARAASKSCACASRPRPCLPSILMFVLCSYDTPTSRNKYATCPSHNEIL